MRAAGILALAVGAGLCACNAGGLPGPGPSGASPAAGNGGAPTAGTGPAGSSAKGAAPSSPDPSCLDTGACRASWTEVGSAAVPTELQTNFVAALGTRVYFADADNNFAQAPAYLKSFDVADGQVRDEPVANDDLCACGLGGTLVGAGGVLFYAANSARSWTPGAPAWVDLPYPDSAKIGDTTGVALDGKVYLVGGRMTLQSMVAYDLAARRWDTLPELPARRFQACAGAVDGKLYVFGGSRDFAGTDPRVVLAYDVVTAQWSTLPDGAGFDGSCTTTTAATWRGRLAVVRDGNALALFDPKAQTWRTLPLPWRADDLVAVAPEDGALYVVSGKTNGDQVSIWKLTLQ